MTSIKFLKEQSPEVSILKKIQYPKNYIFAVYLHDQMGAKLAQLSNKRDKPLSVLPLKKGANFDQKFGYFAIGSPSKNPKKFRIHDFHIFASLKKKGLAYLCPSYLSHAGRAPRTEREGGGRSAAGRGARGDDG